MFRRRNRNKDAIFRQNEEDYIPCTDGIKHEPTIATKKGQSPINVKEDVNTNSLYMDTVIACRKCKKLMPLEFTVKIPSYWDKQKLEKMKKR